MKKAKKQGFTLVEIMIVVAIIGLLAAVGIPSILNAMEKSQEKAKDRNIQDVMRAKGMCQLPTDMGGMLGATNGATVTGTADGNVWSQLDGVTSVDDLKVGDWTLSVNVIGTDPTYTKQ